MFKINFPVKINCYKYRNSSAFAYENNSKQTKFCALTHRHDD